MKNQQMETENQINKVILVTTKGCAGCAIVRKLIDEAITMYHGKVEFEEKDISDIDRSFIKKHNICDFPTTILVKNYNVMFKFTGTRPSIVIHRWFKIHFG